MKLIIIHGSALSAISQKISLIKKDFEKLQIFELNGKEIPLSKILMDLSTGSLFSQKRLFILESIDEKANFSGMPGDESLTVILKFNKTLPISSSILKTTKHLNPQLISLSEKDEISVFPFLDALLEKRATAMKDLEKLIDEYSSQYVITMIYFSLRRLIVPPKKLPDFVLKKMAKQKANFTRGKIVDLYKKTLDTDFKIKTGLIEEKVGLTILANEFLVS